VRIVAATNRDLMELSYKGKFREDLYYRLSTVPIKVPPLRERKEDIHLLFRKFSVDFAEKYRSKPVVLEAEALQLIQNYSWPGNIRQLKNIAEQLSVLDEDKIVSGSELARVLPAEKPGLPIFIGSNQPEQQFSERDIFYKVLYDLRKDLSDLKSIVFDLMQGNQTNYNPDIANNFQQNFKREEPKNNDLKPNFVNLQSQVNSNANNQIIDITENNLEPESLSLEEKEIELIRKSLKKHNGKRKKAALELGISERTLYRKIKQYDLE
jgi:DNA-binding NtrC family response regulator